MGKRARIGVGVAGGVVLLLTIAQIVLPRVAASRVSSRVGRYGSVESVTVKAWPAIELLWGHADSVRVKAGSLTIKPGQAAKLLSQARGVHSMDMSAEVVHVSSLRLTDAVLHKRGDALAAHARISAQDVQAALPAGFGVELLRSEAGRVEVRATGGLFGVGAAVNAAAEASQGKLIAHPLGFLVEGLRLTLFSDPHVYVEGVQASAQGQPPTSYLLGMTASLR